MLVFLKFIDTIVTDMHFKVKYKRVKKSKNVIDRWRFTMRERCQVNQNTNR